MWSEGEQGCGEANREVPRKKEEREEGQEL